MSEPVSAPSFTPGRLAPWLVVALAALLAWPAAAADPKAGFSLRFKDLVSPYRVLAIFALPGEELELEALPPAEAASFEASASAGELSALGPGRWLWRAPEAPGIYPLEITELASGAAMRLNMTVLVPREAKRGERLNGFRIGRYPGELYRGLDNYLPPVGFVEVTPENRDTAVSPRLRLGQFLCKQAGGPPMYLVLQERLLLALELVLDRLNERGYRASTFEVLSGYRSPFYNASIGRVRYSRHIYGDAADVFVDGSGNGMMDDLNGDGRIDIRDAEVVYRIVDELHAQGWFEPYVGGLGKYRRTPVRPPFVHIDTRGFRARW